MKLAVPPVVVQLALATWLVPAYGIVGGAVALLVPLILGSVLTLIVFLRLSTMTFGLALVVRRQDLFLLRDVGARELARFRRAERPSTT